MATFQAGVEWARHNANSLPSDIQCVCWRVFALIGPRSKLLRLYRTAKEGDRKSQDEYLTVLSSAAPGVLYH